MGLTTAELRKSVQLEDGASGKVSRRIFSDPDLYQEELDTIYRRTWQFVGHVSQLPAAGDYLTSYMGEDPVIVTRTRENRIEVHLNSCTHRGMKVCRADRGNAQFFRCTYHGWTFANDGRLIGVPKNKSAYPGFDKGAMGLIPARSTVYQGLIFATWDQHGPSFEDYLGELKWYFDAILARNVGGWEVWQPVQRYNMDGNWKLAAENFAGDTYHALATHVSSIKVGLIVRPGGTWEELGNYCVASRNGHGLLDVPGQNVAFKQDLEAAATLGPEVVDYVHELRKAMEERCEPRQVEMWRVGVFSVFPNFSFNDYSALGMNGMYTWLPRGPHGLEVVQTGMFDRGAPDIVKHIARDAFLSTQSAAGFFGAEDGENFSQIVESTLGAESRQHDFDYSMGMGIETQGPDGWPGRFGPQFTEQNQRNLILHWKESMLAGREAAAAVQGKE